MERLLQRFVIVVALTSAAGCATVGQTVSTITGRLDGATDPNSPRGKVITRSQVWNRTNIPAMNMRLGPRGSEAFAPGETVTCTFREKEMSGRSPKFACVIAKDDEVKVKYGPDNGEVYGEVVASRLLWALGFPADGMYPVRVICRGCPADLGGTPGPGGTMLFTPAVIERKTNGSEIEPGGKPGWEWGELDLVGPAANAATRAQRDALKLLAVFIQHTDSKAQQQRMLCSDARKPAKPENCRRPVMMINDLGLTFGRATRFNNNARGSVNLTDWSTTQLWTEKPGCEGNLPRSFTGTLDNPEISEAGRAFLANLLGQLTDRQLRELFETARVALRPRSPSDDSSGFPTVAEWVDAFKAKRAQLMNRRCANDVLTRN